MTTAALYARYSSTNQRETSLDDQLAQLRAYAEREGWRIVAEHSDRETSGSVPVMQRSGGRALLADALAGRFDVLLLEGLDRLSRDSLEQEATIRRLEHRGIRIIGIADGYDSTSQARKLRRGMRGMINEIYLDDLRHKVHRSQAGQVARGCHAGGMPYGYDSAPTDPHNPDAGRRLVINGAESAIVREIFTRYAEGWPIPKIAADLNARNIPSPRGSSWSVNGIYGHPQKGTGLLNQELYIGRYVWNRSQWVKDPDSGVRKRIERPRSEWRIADHPELRILDDELWKAAKHRQTGKRAARQRKGRPASSLFGGLLRCGHCGGPVVVLDRYKYGCNWHKTRGPAVCPGLTVDRRRAEALLLGRLRDDLLAPAAIARLQQCVRETLRERLQGHDERAIAARTRLPKLEREIENLIDAIARMGWSDTLQRRLQALEAERRDIDQLLSEHPTETVVAMIPRLLERYREAVAQPADALATNPEKARQALREIMGEIKLEPGQGGTWARLSGLYAGVIAVADNGGSGGVIFDLSAATVWIPAGR